MSAYSDWKCGAISDSEYRFYCNEEARRDRIREEREAEILCAYEACRECEYYDNEEGECKDGFDSIECFRESRGML